MSLIRSYRKHDQVLLDTVASDESYFWHVSSGPQGKRLSFPKFLFVLTGGDTEQFKYLPDAYSVDADARLMSVLEIENHHTLIDKRAQIAELWWALDSINWELEVITVNAYTGQRAELKGEPLMKFVSEVDKEQGYPTFNPLEMRNEEIQNLSRSL